MKYIEYKGMKISVEILEERSSYGRKRYLIKPTSGSGTTVVENVFNLKEDA
jgi:hypothetical protein